MNSSNPKTETGINAVAAMATKFNGWFLVTDKLQVENIRVERHYGNFDNFMPIQIISMVVSKLQQKCFMSEDE